MEKWKLQQIYRVWCQLKLWSPERAENVLFSYKIPQKTNSSSIRHVLNLTGFLKWLFNSVIKCTRAIYATYTKYKESGKPLYSLTSSCCASKSKQCVRALHMFRAVATTSLSFSLILNKLPAVEKKTMNLGVGS